MKTRLILLIAAASTLGLAAPAVAGETPAAVAADAQEKPVTQALNNSVAANVQTTDAINAANQNQYELDRAAYRAATAVRREKMAIDDEAYARQQAAYADAMAAWRIQTDDCKRGHQKACNAPTPVPADFY